VTKGIAPSGSSNLNPLTVAENAKGFMLILSMLAFLCRAADILSVTTHLMTGGAIKNPTRPTTATTTSRPRMIFFKKSIFIIPCVFNFR